VQVPQLNVLVPGRQARAVGHGHDGADEEARVEQAQEREVTVIPVCIGLR
jgi:predicted GNAT family acetyltransferase